MLDVLRLLSPRHNDALRPAAPLRRMAGSLQASDGTGATIFPDPPIQDVPGHLAAPRRPGALIEATAYPRTTAVHAPAIAAASFDAGSHETRAMDAPTADENPQRVSPAGSAGARTHAAPALRPTHASASATTRDTGSVEAMHVARPHASHIGSDASIAPLSAGIVAQLAPDRATSPTIHISIDRIEVRAPRPAPKPAAATPRSNSSIQPLDDYLRGKARRP